MKKYLLLFAVALLAACGNPNIIEFDINAPGLNNATFIVKDDAGKSVFGANVINGKCYLKSSLEAEGFYTFDIVQNGTKDRHIPFEIFLEPGKYTIKVDAQNLQNYPEVLSQSKRQQEISDYNNLVNKTGQGAAGLEQFVKTHPHSEFAARFMQEQAYQNEPARFYAIYQLMGTEAKNSAEGKIIGEQLSHLVKLQRGSPAPDIAGNVYDGRTLMQIKAGKKIFLIDFWKSANPLSRTNHDQVKQMYDDYKDKGLQVISVSLDDKELWWKTAVKDDKLPWPQMADLKGFDSPNVINWGIKQEPCYILVTGDWKLLETDVRSLKEADLDIKQYLAKHS